MDETAFLDRLRRVHDAPSSHPGRYRSGLAVRPSFAAFKQVLESVGGSIHAPLEHGQLAEAIQAVIAIDGHRRIVASGQATALLGTLPGVEAARPDQPPAAWQDVDLAIVVAELGVCENAALLTSAVSTPERALLFLAQHLLVVLDLGRLVGDLHDGYASMAHGRQGAALPHHLTWISGPSKTADIEQTLVIGAHGCRSLLVLPYGIPPMDSSPVTAGS
jgi:L-lactate dehydrogenase complex protein LldG